MSTQMKLKSPLVSTKVTIALFLVAITCLALSIHNSDRLSRDSRNIYILLMFVGMICSQIPDKWRSLGTLLWTLVCVAMLVLTYVG